MTKMFMQALTQFGVKEIVGDKHNDQVLDYFKVAGHEWVKNDELAWCSAFINWCAIKSGFEYTGELNARSWLLVGEKVDVPTISDIVILWRKSKDSIYGHVGFYVNETDTHINILGGNQSNKVKISAYPKTQLLEYRRVKFIVD